jgi:hypothetical protein
VEEEVEEAEEAEEEETEEVEVEEAEAEEVARRGGTAAFRAAASGSPGSCCSARQALARSSCPPAPARTPSTAALASDLRGPALSTRLNSEL